ALQIGIVFIVSSFASQLTGRGDHAGARRYALYGLLVALGSEVAVLLAIPHLDVTLGWLALAPDVHAEMQAYMSLRLLSAGAAVGLEALGNYYGATGNTVLPMIGQIVAMVLNVALNWVFIGGQLGMPALGVAGAGL